MVHPLPEGQLQVELLRSTWTYPVFRIWQIQSIDTLIKIVDDNVLGGTGDTLEGRASIQGELDKLEEWPNRNLLNSNKLLQLGTD